MMVSDPAYRAGLDIQVNGMLRLARRKSRSFGKDCLSNPGMLRQHWAKQLDIIYYSPREQDQIKTIREDGRTVDDNASFADLLGFFSPASHPEAELDKAYVAWDEGSFTTRRNFTLLHEIGHYLQETDFELMKRICSFESDYAGKRFEEDACNRFASLAFLPDKFISKWLVIDRSPCARDIHAVFEHGRECSAERNEVRVSRIAVVRRLGALLPSLGYASLIKKPYERDEPPEVVCRAWNDGAVDFSPEFTVAENMLYALAQSGKKRPKNGDGFASDPRMFLGMPTAERPLRGDVVFSHGRQEFAFLVVEYLPEARKETICANQEPFHELASTMEPAPVREADVPAYVLDMEQDIMTAFAEWNAVTPHWRTKKVLSERTAKEQLRFLTDLGESIRAVGCDELANELSETVFSYDTYDAFSPIYSRIREGMPVIDPKRTRKDHLLSALGRYASFLNAD